MGLSLLHPYFLLLGIALPVLALAYRHQEKRTLKRVTSLLIFKNLPKRTLSFRKFKPPFRFFVEVLSLLLLLLAAAGLTLRLTSERKLLLIDNSLSMSAIGLTGGVPESRIDEARRRIKGVVKSDLGSYDVFVTSPVLTKINQSTFENLDQIMAKVQVTQTTDDLESRFLEATAKYGYRQGLIASDRRSESAPSGFETITVGGPSENIYIAGYQWLGDEGLRLKLGHSGPSNVLTKVSIESVNSTNEPTSSSNVYISGDTVKEVDFKLSLKKGDRIKAVAEPVSASVKEDSLRGDNELELDFAASGDKKALVISAEQNFQNRSKLTNIFDWNFTFVSPQSFEALPEENKQQYSVFLFYKVAPSHPPTVSSLFVLPPTDNSLLPIRSESNDSQVTSWQDNHPLNLYLRLSLFKFPAVKIFEEAAGTLPIVNVSGGPIVVAKDQGAVRYAGVGFEIFPYEGKSDPLLSVFTLNLFNWFVSTRDSQQPTISESNTFSESLYNLTELAEVSAAKPTDEQPALHWLVYLALGLLSVEALISVGRRWV